MASVLSVQVMTEEEIISILALTFTWLLASLWESSWIGKEHEKRDGCCGAVN